MRRRKYEENKGLTGMGRDYSVYHMGTAEKLISLSLGAAAGTAAFCIFFGMCIPAAAAGIAGGAAGIKLGKKYFKEKRDENLLRQFRDFLDSMASSLSAGQNISGALCSAHGDIIQLYGEKSLMAEETGIIVNGIKNNLNAEELFEDFARRSGQRDIQTFSDTFGVCNRTGGNMREVIVRTAGTLSEKMQTEKEIDVIASKGKNELLLMAAMPFIIVPMLGTLGESGMSGNNPVNVAVKIVCAVLIVLSVIAGRKITDIRI